MEDDMTSHTKGREWAVIRAPRDIEGIDDFYVGIPDTRDEKRDYSLGNAAVHIAQVFHQDEETARLIAAAPEMLEALKDLNLQCLSRSTNREGRLALTCLHREDNVICPPCRARAIIAKAEGAVPHV